MIWPPGANINIYCYIPIGLNFNLPENFFTCVFYFLYLTLLLPIIFLSKIANYFLMIISKIVYKYLFQQVLHQAFNNCLKEQRLFEFQHQQNLSITFPKNA